MILTVTLLYDSLVDVGHQWFDNTGAFIGARVAASFTEVAAGNGTYISGDLTPPGGAFGITIDSIAQNLAYFSGPLTEFGPGLVAGIDTVLTAAHGSGNWIGLTAAQNRSSLGMASADLDAQLDTILAAAGGGLTGPSTVTILFRDQDLVPVPGVVFALDGVGTGMANGSGVATFGAADGSYTVVSFPTAGVIFANTALVVSGNTPLTITGATQMPPLPTPASDPFCDLTLDFISGSGTAMSGGMIRAQLLVPSAAASKMSSGFVLGDIDVNAISGVDGRATLRVLRNSAFTTSNTQWLVTSSAPGFPPQRLTVSTGGIDLGTYVV